MYGHPSRYKLIWYVLRTFLFCHLLILDIDVSFFYQIVLVTFLEYSSPCLRKSQVMWLLEYSQCSANVPNGMLIFLVPKFFQVFHVFQVLKLFCQCSKRDVHSLGTKILSGQTAISNRVRPVGPAHGATGATVLLGWLSQLSLCN